MKLDIFVFLVLRVHLSQQPNCIYTVNASTDGRADNLVAAGLLLNSKLVQRYYILADNSIALNERSV